MLVFIIDVQRLNSTAHGKIKPATDSFALFMKLLVEPLVKLVKAAASSTDQPKYRNCHPYLSTSQPKVDSRANKGHFYFHRFEHKACHV